jgi:putative hydrolase of the HAD superfamily
MMVTPENRPKVIFLDAVGTLFGIKGSVGEVYRSIAQQFGVEVDATALNKAFFQSFRNADTMAFPGVEAKEIPHHEYMWWEAIAMQTFFAALYHHFAIADPWFVYPDILAALTQWRAQDIELGVLSNFDSRLHTVLPALGLAEFFSSVTVSTEVGAAKPDPQIFKAALKKHDCQPIQAWHIGDSQKEDYEGAKAAGLRAVLLKR